MGADGAVGWWRAVNFDGPRVFTRRHDPKGLALRVGPAGSPRAGEQTWSPDTNVVRTRLPAPAGLLEVVDL
ncbi:MAG: glycoside hydrolase family 15 protein, partial [Acidimicrobiales bacterium]